MSKIIERVKCLFGNHEWVLIRHPEGFKTIDCRNCGKHGRVLLP